MTDRLGRITALRIAALSLNAHAAVSRRKRLPGKATVENEQAVVIEEMLAELEREENGEVV